MKRRHWIPAAIVLFALAACGGHSVPPVGTSASSSGVRTTLSTATPAPNPSAYSWRTAGVGRVNGTDNAFKTTNNDADTKPTASPPTYDGDLKSTDPGARTGGGGQGPTGSAIDGITCDTSMPNTYHVHAFVGIYVNGRELALPDAVGIYHASADQTDPYSGWPNQTDYGTCFYHIHTHDPSGLVHMEAYNSVPITQSLFRLGELLDIWGVKVTTGQFGPYFGTVTVYTSGNSAKVPCNPASAATCEIGASQYKLWSGDPHTMPLYSHEAIWIEVGSGNPAPSHLPGVYFALKQ